MMPLVEQSFKPMLMSLQKAINSRKRPFAERAADDLSAILGLPVFSVTLGVLTTRLVDGWKAG